MFLIFKKSHAHLKYTTNISAKFQIVCFYSLGGFDYTNFLPYTEVLPQNCPIEIYKFVKIYVLSAKSHMHIFNRLVTSVQSFKWIV